MTKMSGDKDSRSDQTCCLIEHNERCRKQSGNASFNFRVQKLVEQRKLKFSLDSNAKHTYICDFHKNIIQKARSKRKRKDSDDENDINDIDLSQLPVGTLRRYKRHYKIPTKPGMSKSQLIEDFEVCYHVVLNHDCLCRVVNFKSDSFNYQQDDKEDNKVQATDNPMVTYDRN